MDNNEEVMTEDEEVLSMMTQLRDDYVFECPENHVISGFVSE